MNLARGLMIALDGCSVELSPPTVARSALTLMPKASTAMAMPFHLHTQAEPRGLIRPVALPDNLGLHGEDGSRFELKDLIRPGGNGVVFRAHRYSNKGAFLGPCAVKMLKKLDPTRVDRFDNETRVMGLLDSPRVSRIFGRGRVTLDGVDIPWAAIELGGRNLREEVEESAPLTVPELRKAVHEIGQAIQHVHEAGFIHRDLKPANFVLRRGRGSEAMMIDFGLAKRLAEDVSARPLDDFTEQMEFVGPVFYASPELLAYARNKKTVVDARSDIFQFGKVAWFLATGDVLAGIPSVRRDPTKGALRGVIMEILAEDPVDRPQSALDATTSLVRALG